MSVFDDSSPVMWHIRWHKPFHLDYGRENRDASTLLYDSVMVDVTNKGVMYDGMDTSFLTVDKLPMYTRRSCPVLLSRMQSCEGRDETDKPMTVMEYCRGITTEPNQSSQWNDPDLVTKRSRGANLLLTPQSLEKGKDLFIKYCAHCHGSSCKRVVSQSGSLDGSCTCT